MKKRSIFRGLLILIVFAIIVLVALYSQNYLKLPGEQATEIQEPTGDTVVTLEDYKVYDLVDVPFRFVLADVRLSNTKPINFELSRFQSDEGIILSSLDEYRSEITRNGYDLGIQNVTTQLTSNENELLAKILIPIKNNYRQIINVNISGIKTDLISLNLSDAEYGKPEDLGKSIAVSERPVEEKPTPTEHDVEITEVPELDPPEETDLEVVPVSNTTSFSSGSLISKDLILYKGLEEYHRVDFASRVRILLVNVTFDYEEEVSIVAARLHFTDTDDLAFALGPEYVIENGNNVLGKAMKQETGSLIFQMDNCLYDLVNQPYTVEVRFEHDGNWLRIPMNQQAD